MQVVKWVDGLKMNIMSVSFTATFDLQILMRVEGTCEISINAVDPAAVVGVGDRLVDYYISPNQFREMAGWVVEQCIGGNPSMGGYVTRNISNAIEFLATTSIPPLTWDPSEPAEYRKSHLSPNTTNDWSQLLH